MHTCLSNICPESVASWGKLAYNTSKLTLLSHISTHESVWALYHFHLLNCTLHHILYFIVGKDIIDVFNITVLTQSNVKKIVYDTKNFSIHNYFTNQLMTTTAHESFSHVLYKQDWSVSTKTVKSP